jgi:hypothetical protein
MLEEQLLFILCSYSTHLSRGSFCCNEAIMRDNNERSIIIIVEVVEFE